PTASFHKVRPLAAEAGGQVLLALSGGGTRRNPHRVKAGDIVWARFVTLDDATTGAAPDLPPSIFEADERYLFEVSLDDVEPRIWRRFSLATDATFAELHGAIQDAAGWLDYHLYEFFRGSERRPEMLAASPGLEDLNGEPFPDPHETPVRAYFSDRRR